MASAITASRPPVDIYSFIAKCISSTVKEMYDLIKENWDLSCQTNNKQRFYKACEMCDISKHDILSGYQGAIIGVMCIDDIRAYFSRDDLLTVFNDYHKLVDDCVINREVFMAAIM